LALEKKQEKPQIVLTAGELFDGHVIDLIAPAPPRKGLRLVVSCDGDNGPPLVAPQALVDGKLYRPIVLDDELLQAVRLPEKSIACSSTRELFDRVKFEILARAELQDAAASVATCCMFANWVLIGCPSYRRS
jgi:hypothetical protein